MAKTKTKTKSEPAKIGRPPRVRPQIPGVAAAMRRAEAKRGRADELRADADRIKSDAMCAAAADHSLADIAAVAGVSKARVHQIVRGADQRR
jgi:hypothetical protein